MFGEGCRGEGRRGVESMGGVTARRGRGAKGLGEGGTQAMSTLSGGGPVVNQLL